MQSTPSVPVEPNNMPWYAQTWFTIVMLIFVPPVGWYFLWKYRDWHLGAKIALVIASIVWVIYANVSEDARQKAEKHATAQGTSKSSLKTQSATAAKTQTSPKPTPKTATVKSYQQTGKQPVEQKMREQERPRSAVSQNSADTSGDEAVDPSNADDDGCKEVKSSAWDGSVFEVKLYLRSNLHDWKSTEFVEWSPVAKDPKLRISVVRCKFRTKNALGAYVIKNWVFYLGCDGKVLSYENYP
jgi:hypothetical protein